MQPLNQAERRSAFMNFVIFFAVTVLLILTTAFFSVQVPFKDNERLREANKTAVNSNAFMDRFQAKLSEALSTLEIVNNDKYLEQAESYDSRIQETISEMSAMVVKDSVSNKDFYRSVIDAINASRIAKKELRDIKSKNADAGEWKEKYDRLEQNFRDYQAEIMRRSQQPAH